MASIAGQDIRTENYLSNRKEDGKQQLKIQQKMALIVAESHGRGGNQLTVQLESQAGSAVRRHLVAKCAAAMAAQ